MGVPDNGPVIVGVTWWLTSFCGVFLVLRIYAKVSRKQALWRDDYILILSWLLLLAQAIFTQAGQLLGFGKRTEDIPVASLATIALGTSISASISCFSSTLSKISFGVTLLRLTSGYLRAFVWFCIVTLFLVMLPSALGTWFQCTPMEKAWNSAIEGTCWDSSGTIHYGIFNAAWCATADFALALLPWYLIWGLQLKFREKVGVGVAMSMGVLAGVCAIVKGAYLIQLGQQDFYYNGKDVTIWTAVETATAIIAASIPVLRVFFKQRIFSYNRSHMRSNHSVPLSRLNRSQHCTTTTTIEAMGKDKAGGWSTTEGGEDDTSQRGILEAEERAIRGDMATYDDEGILKTDTVTVTVEGDARSDHKVRSFLGI
ncbi:hypothetical protein BDW02DRAFT_490550 [Decorospora gaudefroyi]|uniref:Rhodopsin domain-containing protein n=1 Tax=Decorospora gaudefroyi TaxID=184978 RepID=A0A6A5KP41_9PLEO|nr:hypothetical protein BDW02DRAFT_490550 [Decorospora gaudefroyi]